MTNPNRPASLSSFRLAQREDCPTPHFSTLSWSPAGEGPHTGPLLFLKPSKVCQETPSTSASPPATSNAPPESALHYPASLPLDLYLTSTTHTPHFNYPDIKRIHFAKGKEHPLPTPFPASLLPHNASTSTHNHGCWYINIAVHHVSQHLPLLWAEGNFSTSTPGCSPCSSSSRTSY